MVAAAAVAAVAVIGLVIAGAISRPSKASSTTSTVATVEGKTLGSPDAPVTLTAWEDFQCPFCKQANNGAVAQVINDYVNTGKVKLVFAQFPFLGNGGSKDESMLAAEASECAAAQSLFWPYHDALYAAQSGENRGTFTTPNLEKMAGDTGLDQGAFNSCLESGTYKSVVDQQKSEGKALGINTTPTFIVNGQRITGAQPYSVFKDAIERALQAAQ